MTGLPGINYGPRAAKVSDVTIIDGYYDEDGQRHPGRLTVLTMRDGAESWAVDEDGGKIEFAVVDVGGYDDFAITSQRGAWKFFATDIDKLAGVVVSPWLIEAVKIHNAARI